MSLTSKDSSQSLSLSSTSNTSQNDINLMDSNTISPSSTSPSLANTTTTSISNTSLSNDQLLDYIKKQKLKIKRIEKENLELQQNNKELLSKSQNISTNNLISKQDHTISNFDSILFWELINIKKSQPFQTKLAKVAINSLISAISKSKIGQSFPNKHGFFSRWKNFTIYQRFLINEKQTLENSKVLKELEQRNSKLKALLARTHLSNQRNNEDTNVIKRSQKEALLELKNIKEKEDNEKGILMETLRLASIKSAFQCDIELTIQKAAEDLFYQQQKFTESNLLIKESKEVLNSKIQLNHLHYDDEIDEKTNLITTLQNELNSKILINENLNSEKEIIDNSLNNALNKIKQLEKQINILQVIVEDEKNSRKDIEIELNITNQNLKNMLKNIEENAINSANKKNNELIEELIDLKSNLNDVKNNSFVLADELTVALNDLNTIKSSNKNFIDQTDEINRLRNVISKIKSQQTQQNHHQNDKSKYSICKEDIILILDLVDSSINISKQYLNLSNELNSTNIKLNEINNYWKKSNNNTKSYFYNLLNIFIPVVKENLIKYLNQQCSNLDLIKLNNGLNAMEIILENCINNPSEAFLASIDEPMTWEATSASLSSDNDLKILIPIGVYSSMLTNVSNKYLKLELKYSCLDLDGDLSNFVLSLNNINNNNEIIINNNVSDKTNHKLYESKTFLIVSNGDELLRLRNINNSQVFNISYSFRLVPITESDIIYISKSIQGCSKSINKESYIQNIILLNDINSLISQNNDNNYNNYHDISIDNSISIYNSIAIKSELDITKFEELIDNVKKCIYNIDTNLTISIPKNINIVSEKEFENVTSNKNLSQPTIFVCESLNIKPADEFRIEIPNTMIKRPFKLKYEFSLPHTSQTSCDIGFSILEKLSDGSLPQIQAYRRVKSKGESKSIIIKDSDNDEILSTIILFDNTYSWYKSKEIKYFISIESIYSNSDINKINLKESLNNSSINQQDNVDLNSNKIKLNQYSEEELIIKKINELLLKS